MLLIRLFIILQLLCSPVNAAEFLIKVSDTWTQNITKEADPAKWPQEVTDKYNARLIKGNPITVRRDGYPWGKKEVDSDEYMIVKVLGMSPTAAKAFMVETDGKQARFRFDMAGIAAKTRTITVQQKDIAGKFIDRTLVPDPISIEP